MGVVTTFWSTFCPLMLLSVGKMVKYSAFLAANSMGSEKTASRPEVFVGVLARARASSGSLE